MMHLFFIVPVGAMISYVAFVRRDLLAPEIVAGLPLLIALILYSLLLSDHYSLDVFAFFFVSLSITSMVLGMLLLPIYRKKGNYAEIILKRLSSRRLRFLILCLLVISILVFTVEAFLVTPPLLSKNPNKSYMEFGLPIVHHLIYFCYFSILLSYLLYRMVGSRKMLFSSCLVSLILFSLMMQRLSIVICVVILASSYFYFYKKSFSVSIVLKLILAVGILLAGFVYIGEQRLDGVSKNYIVSLTKMNSEVVPSFLALPYIYTTAGVQNTINQIVQFSDFQFGFFSLASILPLFDPSILLDVDLSKYRFTESFTTFVFPSDLFVDFGFVAPFFAFIFGFFLKYIYMKAISGSVSLFLFYFSYALPSSLFLFFSDNFFTSSFLIFFVASFGFSKFLKVKRVVF
jgi:oligosaccharide repeat unit polymerase